MTLLCVAEMSAASGAEVHEEIGVDIGERGSFSSHARIPGDHARIPEITPAARSM